MRRTLPLLLIVIASACASSRSAPAADEPSWSVLYDGQTRSGASGNECRIGRDGKQVCGYHCRTGSDGVVRCAATPQGSCTIGGAGRAICRDSLFPDDASDGGLSP